MGTISDKTTYLNTTKTLIREKINDLGQNLDTEDTFRSYVEALEQVYEEYPKIEENDVTEPSINNTKVGKMEIDLKGNTEQFTTTGKNLFDKNNMNLIEGYVSQGGVVTYQPGVGDKTIYIPCKANTTYTIQKMISMRFRVGCCDVTPVNNTTLNPFSGNQQTKTSYTLTSGASSQYIVLWCVDKDESNIQQQIFDSIQIEEGSTVTPYEPYTGGTASPNPSYPQEVKVVSGENKVKVVNKNLYNKDTDDVGRVYSDSGVYGSSPVWTTSDWIPVKSTSQYVLSEKTTGTNNLFFSEFDSNKTFIKRTAVSPLTPTNATKYVRLSFKNDIGTYDIQLEEGSTATTYEEHKEQDFPISLHSRNLFDISKIVKGRVDSGNIGYIEGTSAITLNSNSFSFTTTANYRGVVSNLIIIKPETQYHYKGTNSIDIGHIIDFYDKNGNWLSRSSTVAGQSNSDFTFTTISNSYYMRLSYMLTSSGSATISNPQLEEGTTATTYQPFYDYELVKIGNYQDFIYSIRGKNLFDKDNILLGYALNADTGLPFTNAEFITSDFIEIEFNNSYIANGGTGTRILYCYYDSNKTYLGTRTEATYNTPFIIRNSSAKYIRVCFNDTTNYSNIQLERGSIATSYEPYGSKNLHWYIKKKTNKVVLNGSETIYDNWQNGTISDYIQFYLKSDFLGGNYAESSNQAAYSNYFRCLSSTVWRYV